jgi:hypothetical protein
MEASEASKLAKLMNANPFEFPVSGSRMICNIGNTDNHNSVFIRHIWKQDKKIHISWSCEYEVLHSHKMTYLRCLKDDTKCRKRVIKKLLIYLWVQVPNKNVSTNI